MGSERAALFTYGLGGPIGALIMYASIARVSWAPDYDWAMTVADRAQWTQQTVAVWGEPEELGRALLTVMFTDIVNATARAAVLGDGRWRDLLADHDTQVREPLAASAVVR